MAFTIWNVTHGLHILGRRFAFIYPLLEITGSGYIVLNGNGVCRTTTMG